jgi:hypothetical protein
MKGQCLCGSISFHLSIKQLDVYQCFCSLCQKQSGTQSNFAAIIPEGNFTFLSGEASIGHWTKESGFTSQFCMHCGSPVPNRLRGKPYYWVPVGLIDTGVNANVVSHIYKGSQRAITNLDGVEVLDEFPDGGIDEHIAKLSRSYVSD